MNKVYEAVICGARIDCIAISIISQCFLLPGVKKCFLENTYNLPA